MLIAPILFYAGVLLVFIGIIGIVGYTLILASRRGQRDDHGEEKTEDKSGKGQVEGGGVIFIGPIPIVFGSNKRIAKWMVIAAILITIALVFETLFALGVV
ncbi:hypothetical protein B9Q04_13345 [Candidatus Marsarchaeota G2 archaeon BE_D]|uniref:TIGR00304 family protein n=1 Tax=Candidatus Marsarchaeota G2 archaeon BE_D TaxID=1978158 RepID=A0A2R6C7V6_9ARCH|nr:MAG: hypothetical protein B9Q04_13345 [Candidatus Marsarchaeota G2 archaeon BE_D]